MRFFVNLFLSSKLLKQGKRALMVICDSGLPYLEGDLYGPKKMGRLEIRAGPYLMQV